MEEPRTGIADRIRKTGKALRKSVPKSPRGEVLFWGLFSALAFYFLWSAFSGPQGAIELLRLKGALHDLEEKNDVLMRKNQEMEKEIYLLRKSRVYLEKVAREEYGYSYPGETVYRFEDPDPVESKGRGEEEEARLSPAVP